MLRETRKVAQGLNFFFGMKKASNRNIVTACLMMMVLAFATSFTAQSQELAARKHGTVLEQIKLSNLNNNSRDKIREMLDYALTFKGARYRSGSSSPKGFDCSGFTSYIFRQFGYTLNRSSRGQISDGRRVDRDDLRPGDLVFFNGRSVGGRIGHVGIVTEVKDSHFKFIHSASSVGVTESKSTEPYYQRRYVGACRVLE